MKRFFTFFIGLLFTISLTAQQEFLSTENYLDYHTTFDNRGNPVHTTLNEFIWVLDSFYQYNGEGQEWLLNERTQLLNRDQYGNALLSLREQKDIEGAWLKRDSTVRTFHSFDIENESIRWSWNSETAAWVDTTFYRKADENGNILELSSKYWSYGNNDFTGAGYKLTYTYAANNIIDQSTLSFWYGDIEGWKPYSLLSYFYDINGNVGERTSQRWDEGLNDWKNAYRYLHTYDGNNNLIEIYAESYGVDDIWNAFYKEFYSYENELLSSKERQDFINVLGWVNARLELFTHDFDGNITETLRQNWGNDTGIWINNRLELTTYNEEGTATQVKYLQWNEDENIWENQSKVDYFLTQLLSTDDLLAAPLTLFPNPSTGILTIDTNISLEKASVEIYAISGKLMQIIALKQQTTIDISRLPSGFYFVNIRTPAGRVVKKIEKI